ncbi:chromate transporter, partial [Burkholderia pseudomallei]|uniref:chromate transporter n=1 Tax=Burkholderia pseudomallei TaxID=28450 RepID=UPI002AB5AC3F
ALVAALGTFLPCYLFTVVPAPYVKKYGHLPSVKAFVDGITAAVALVTIVLLWRFKKLQEPVIVAAAAVVGLLAYPWLHR